MTDPHTPCRGRINGLVTVSLFSLILTSGLPADLRAAPTSQGEQIAKLEARVGQLERDLAVARAVESLGKQVDAINKEIVVVKETLVRIKQGVDAGSRAEPATPGAWWALGVVGVLFVIMWGVVSVLREAARVNEVLWASAVKAVVADQQKPANQALIDKVEDLRKLAEKVPPFGGRELWTAILREAFPIVRRNAQR